MGAGEGLYGAMKKPLSPLMGEGRGGGGKQRFAGKAGGYISTLHRKIHKLRE
jgi:hypothetical protein